MNKTITILVMALIASGILFSNTYAQNKSGDESKKWTCVKVNYDNSGAVKPGEIINYIESKKIRVLRIRDDVDAVVYPNTRVLPTTNTTQSELSIDMHPTNPDIIFGSANTTNWPVTTLYGCGAYLSTNGGTTWGGSDNPALNPTSGDPAAVVGANGNFYLGFITSGGGQGIARSTNNGASWTNYTVAADPSSSSDLLDKNHMMIDKKTGSPYLNRLYVVYTAFVTGSANNNQICLRFSSDNGATWSAEKNLSSALNAGSHNQGVNVQTGPNGEVYVTWAVYDQFAAGVYGEDAIGFAKSTDGGVTFSAPVKVYAAANFGIRNDALAPNSIRVSSFPSMAVDRTGGSRNGYIYITWPQINVSPAGTDPDIVMIKSSNGGTTWTTPIRINNDAINNGKNQYYPWCTVDQSTGSVYTVWYDSRNAASNDSAEVYMAVSYDGAATFTNVKVSDAKFKPGSISGLATGYQGDYIGITGVNGVAYPFWAENRTGNYQAWTSKVMFGPSITHTSLANTENLAGPYKVGVKISSAVSLNASKLYVYWTRGTSFLDSAALISVTADSFYANIPGNGSIADYRYYIYAEDIAGGYGSLPAGAPANYFSFSAFTDMVPPVIVHTALPDQTKDIWPVAVTANVTDNIGVDSVWVVYKLKFSGSLRTFSLAGLGSGNYSGLFNIDTSLIALGDTIYYRIIARDLSTAHNLGYNPSSSGFNTFKFVSDPTPPVITHTALKNQSRLKWPALVKANVTDNVGVGSVICQYRINNGSIRTFTLSFASGSSYSGYFNIDTSLVAGGDSIFYQIKATDNSTNHNITYLPVSGYYSFKVINAKAFFLVVNDDVTLKGRESDDKKGTPDLDGVLGASSTLFATTLNNAGFYADSVQFASMDITTLANYDAVILSAGTKTTLPFSDQTKRTALVDYVNNGGKTWVEGGEVGYMYRQNSEVDAAFRRTILNDSIWLSDYSTGRLLPTTLGLTHNMFNVPNVITGPWSITGTGYGYRDVMRLVPNKPGVRKLAGWTTTYPDSGGIIVHYENNNPSDIRNIFFTFAIGAFTDQAAAKKLIENTANLFVTTNPVPTMSITALVQGLYNGSVMVPDTVIVEIRNQVPPYALIQSQKIFLNTSGVGSGKFNYAVNGTPYYMVIKHRNAVETWSAAPQSFSSTALTYDFTNAITKAYGNNLILVGTKYCLISGDVTNDGISDGNDLAAVENGVNGFASGYLSTDLNGDGIIDGNDLALVDNSVNAFVSKIVPPGAADGIKAIVRNRTDIYRQGNKNQR